MHDTTVIEREAFKARAWAEEHASEVQREHGLWGMCARASANLVARLQRQGIDARLVFGRVWGGGHVFVLVGDLVVDVTATQFDGFGEYREVEIVPVDDAEQEYPWAEPEMRFASIEDLCHFQARTGWPEDQTVQDDDYLVLWA